MVVRCSSSISLLSQLLLLSSAHSLLSHSGQNNYASLHQRISLPRLSSLPLQSISTDDQDLSIATRHELLERINLNNYLTSYSFHWESLLTREYQDTVAELQARRKSYSRSQLEASGLSLFNAVATPETELFGEKIVRVTLLEQSHKYNNGGTKKLREKFKRGDVLVMTAEMLFRGK